MRRYTVTVRYASFRYHTFEVEAPDVAAALHAASEELPDDVRESGDLVEVRRAPEPQGRAYLED